MATVYLTRRVRFSASHRLHNPLLSDDDNRRVYGKCNSTNGHGHNYELFVTVKGQVDENGMVMNLNDLKAYINEALIYKVDHKHLNHDVPFLLNVNPTSENLVVAFWKQLEVALPNNILYELKLVETENNVVVYRGE